MKVGFDITPIMYGRGVSRYTSNVIRALLQHTTTQVTGYGYSFRQKRKLEELAHQLGIQHTAIKAIPQSLQQKLWSIGLNSIQHTLKDIDVFHSWDWIQPPDTKLPIVSTIHDLAILHFPETAHPKVMGHHQQSWRHLKKVEADIIAVSQSTKNDILDLLGFPKYRVHVIPEALPAEFVEVSQRLTEDEVDRIKTQLSLNQPFLLFVGTREPRKNLRRLVEAWLPMAKDYQLIIAGAEGWDDALPKHAQLRLLGSVTDAQLAVLYGEAELLCYPSLYEGFGLPILEAFLHGTPVLTADRSAMPEVAGNAAELVNPESVADIRKGIETILNESTEQQKKRLQRMILRLQLFNWQKVAEQTNQVYSLAIQHRS